MCQLQLAAVCIIAQQEALSQSLAQKLESPAAQTPAAQSSNYNFEHITTEHGLSSNKIESILQDRDGLYWIATKNGLNRFDGTNFKIYRNDPNDSTSLTHNNCTYLLEDKNGDIWVATYKGVSKFIKKQGVFQPIYFHNPLRNFEVSNRIFTMTADLEGNVWIAGNGLWKYDIETQAVKLISISKTDSTSISDHGLIMDLCFDTINNGLWLTTGTQLNFYSITQNVFYHSLHNPKHWKVFDAASPHEISLDHKNRLWFLGDSILELSYFEGRANEITNTGKKISSGCRQMTADNTNRIWLAYWGSGSEIYDPFTNTSDHLFFTARHRYSLLNPKSRLMCVDQQNNYWIASNDGISIYNDANQYYEWHTLTNAETDSTPSLTIKAIAKSQESKLWVATTVGLYEYDLLRHSYRQVNKIKQIRSIVVVDDHLWLALNDHILQMDLRSELIRKRIDLQKGIIFVQKGNHHDLWVGIWVGGLYHIDLVTYEIQHFTKNNTENSLKSNSLICNLVDGENFWIGYNVGNGFSKYSTLDNHFTHYHPEEKDMSSSNAGTINVITKDHKGNFWIGTHGGGIFRFDEHANTYHNFQQHHGLKSNYINSILPDGENNLWISSVDGINYFNDKTQTIIPLEIDLVLEGNDFVQNGLATNGKLYFFNKNEFVEIDPSAYQQAMNFPKLVISSFKVFDKEFPLYGQPRDIGLTYEENFFTIQFSSIKAHPLKNVRYAYKLEGFDKDWIESGIQQKASYTNVPHGEYTFKIKATNDAGEWSDVLLSSVIRITPPFWRTWWFIVLCVCLISGIAYSLYRYRMQHLKRIYSIKSKISQDLHDEVGSTLSSINVYSSIASKSLNNNAAITEKALKHISDNSRQVMENMGDIVWAINSGNPGTSTLEDKLKNYGYELLTPLNINVSYAIAGDAEKRLSHMEARKNILLIAKEAMNNIARYSKATDAWVQMDINHKHLTLNIRDNGNGFNMATRRNGNGLHNMRNRTEALGGKFAITSEKDLGTSLTCTIPVTSISNI